MKFNKKIEVNKSKNNVIKTDRKVPKGSKTANRVTEDNKQFQSSYESYEI